jgi:hypothetical protein
LRNLRARSALSMLLAGAILVLPLLGLLVLGRVPGSEPPLKCLAVRSAKRVRSASPVAPRLTNQQWGLDSGRKRPSAILAPLPPLPSGPGQLRFRLVSSPIAPHLAARPLRC